MDTWHRLLDRYRLKFAGLAFPYTLQDMLDSLKLAQQFGQVQYLNSQVMDAFVIGDDAVRLTVPRCVSIIFGMFASSDTRSKSSSRMGACPAGYVKAKTKR